MNTEVFNTAEHLGALLEVFSVGLRVYFSARALALCGMQQLAQNKITELKNSWTVVNRIQEKLPQT